MIEIESLQKFSCIVDQENESYQKLITHYRKASPYCINAVVQMLLSWKDQKSPTMECTDAKLQEKREVRETVNFTSC